MKVAAGCCQACDDLVAVEILPTAIRDAELHKQLNALQVQLNESTASFLLENAGGSVAREKRSSN